MARSTSSASVRRQPNTAGRVDNLAIHLLSRAVGQNDNVILKTIYGTFKPEIDRAIKTQLGGIRVHVPEMLQYSPEVQAKPPKSATAPRERGRAKPEPASDDGIMDMHVGSDGVYEVSDAR
jgi:hypothetical protein